MSTMQRFYDDTLIAVQPADIERQSLVNLAQADPGDILSNDFLIWVGW
jgi:hypothetical protein